MRSLLARFTRTEESMIGAIEQTNAAGQINAPESATQEISWMSGLSVPAAPDSRICYAPGTRCLGCAHYYGKADKCEYAPHSEPQVSGSSVSTGASEAGERCCADAEPVERVSAPARSEPFSCAPANPNARLPLLACRRRGTLFTNQGDRNE